METTTRTSASPLAYDRPTALPDPNLLAGPAAAPAAEVPQRYTIPQAARGLEIGQSTLFELRRRIARGAAAP